MERMAGGPVDRTAAALRSRGAPTTLPATIPIPGAKASGLEALRAARIFRRFNRRPPAPCSMRMARGFIARTALISEQNGERRARAKLAGPRETPLFNLAPRRSRGRRLPEPHCQAARSLTIFVGDSITP